MNTTKCTGRAEILSALVKQTEKDTDPRSGDFFDMMTVVEPTDDSILEITKNDNGTFDYKYESGSLRIQTF